MKHTKTNRLAALLLLAVGVMGCTKEETLPGHTPNTARIPMTISVTDGGYAANDKFAAQSRAVENGYATTFTAGDQIGLFVVKPNNSYIHVNIALTLTDNGNGTFAWTPPADTKLYYEGADARYFAYYPYQSDLTGDLVPSASDAAGYFDDVVSKWTPATDQSSHALYTAQDLMVGSGTVAPKQADGTYPLALNMTHAMALVVIETPTTEYTLSDDANYTWTAAAPDTKFKDFTPYSPTAGTYRYLVKPAQNGVPDLMGSYTVTSGNTKEYAIVQNGIGASEYAHYRVDNGTATIIEKTHTLQVGDFYLKDGSLLSGSGSETLTEAQKASCIGIVFYVGNPTNSTNGDPLLGQSGHHPGCTHGLIVALHEAKHPSGNTAAKMYWSISNEQVNNWTNSDDRGDNKVNITEVNKIQGYANTVALKAYNAQQVDNNLKVLPVAAIEEYNTNYPTPTSSSGWYVPSIMELKQVCWGQGSGQSVAGRDMLNSQFDKAGGTKFDGSQNYWSSSEHNSGSEFALHVDFARGYADFYYKNTLELWVRGLSAF